MKLASSFLIYQGLNYTRGGGGGGTRISSDRDDRRIFLGLKFFYSESFLGRKIWQVFFWVA